MGRTGTGLQAVLGNQQQGAYLGHIKRTDQQAAEEKITPPIAPQAAIDEILNCRPRNRVDPGELAVSQTLPSEYGGIDAGRLQEGEAKRIRK